MQAEPNRKLFTVEEYHRLGESGIFAPDDRVELVDGEIFQMSPVGPRHASIVDRAAELLTVGLAGRAIVRVQSPLRLDMYSEPQPDIAVLARREDFYASRHPGAGDTLLAIEIADTSLAYDRDSKIPAYARSGVGESWIVDLAGDVILVFRDPGDHGYRNVSTLERGETVFPLAFADFAVSVDGVLG